MSPEPSASQFSLTNFKTLVNGIELLYSVGQRLSKDMANQRCEYLIQEASMAFVKTMMSVIGFLRFIPESRFYANAGETVTDLSSASVMGRQVLEDTISFFYLSEPKLTAEEKSFRRLVWKFHAKSEHIDSARLAGVANVEQSLVCAQCERLRQEVKNHPMLATITPDRLQHNVSKGYEAHILHDQEILKRRGILAERYDLPHKVLSNFTHFSELSHHLMMQTTADWQKSWGPFLHPTFAVAMFIAELIDAFLQTFPQTRRLLRFSEHEIIEKMASDVEVGLLRVLGSFGSSAHAAA